MTSGKKKIFVPDTNVLFDDCQCIEHFADNTTVIPIWVVQELDRLKKHESKNYFAQQASAKLAYYRKRGHLHVGVPTDAGGILRTTTQQINLRGLLKAKFEETNDMRILSAAAALAREEQKRGLDAHQVTLVTNDLNLMLLTDALNVKGLTAEEYTSDLLKRSVSDVLYTGITHIKFKDDNPALLGLCKYISLDEVARIAHIGEELIPNQCCYLEMPSGTVQAIYKAEMTNEHGVARAPRFNVIDKKRLWNGSPVETGNGTGNLLAIDPNPEQLFALALLKDSSIFAVTLVGPAGTGKTLFALHAGIEQYQRPFTMVHVFRPMIELEPMGFMPGTAAEKFKPWTLPISNNIAVLAANMPIEKGDGIYRQSREQSIQDFLDQYRIEVEPITFIRGATQHNEFVIADDAQNFSRSQVKTMVGRAGVNTKMVFNGDLDQIDPPMTVRRSGLLHMIDRYRGHKRYGHIVLTTTERSELAAMSRLLDN